MPSCREVLWVAGAASKRASWRYDVASGGSGGPPSDSVGPSSALPPCRRRCCCCCSSCWPALPSAAAAAVAAAAAASLASAARFFCSAIRAYLGKGDLRWGLSQARLGRAACSGAGGQLLSAPSPCLPCIQRAISLLQRQMFKLRQGQAVLQAPPPPTHTHPPLKRTYAQAPTVCRSCNTGGRNPASCTSSYRSPAGPGSSTTRSSFMASLCMCASLCPCLCAGGLLT